MRRAEPRPSSCSGARKAAVRFGSLSEPVAPPPPPNDIPFEAPVDYRRVATATDARLIQRGSPSALIQLPAVVYEFRATRARDVRRRLALFPALIEFSHELGGSSATFRKTKVSGGPGPGDNIDRPYRVMVQYERAAMQGPAFTKEGVQRSAAAGPQIRRKAAALPPAEEYVLPVTTPTIVKVNELSPAKREELRKLWLSALPKADVSANQQAVSVALEEGQHSAKVAPALNDNAAWNKAIERSPAHSLPSIFTLLPEGVTKSELALRWRTSALDVLTNFRAFHSNIAPFVTFEGHTASGHYFTGVVLVHQLWNMLLNDLPNVPVVLTRVGKFESKESAMLSVSGGARSMLHGWLAQLRDARLGRVDL